MRRLQRRPQYQRECVNEFLSKIIATDTSVEKGEVLGFRNLLRCFEYPCFLLVLLESRRPFERERETETETERERKRATRHTFYSPATPVHQLKVKSREEKAGLVAELLLLWSNCFGRDYYSIRGKFEPRVKSILWSFRQRDKISWKAGTARQDLQLCDVVSSSCSLGMYMLLLLHGLISSQHADL